MTCVQCKNDPCSCSSTPKTGSAYYYKQCAAPSCTVMIGARIGKPIDPPYCKWCQAGTAYYREYGAVRDPAKCPPPIAILLAVLWMGFGGA